MTERPGLLIVEADVLARHPLAQYLRECGYRVFEAASLAEAQLLLDQPDTAIDVALADASQGSEGFTLASWIRKHHPTVQVTLASSVSNTTEKAANLCEEGPAVDKPYQHQFVLQTIRRLVAARDRSRLAG